jgi:sRNA-binding carbon storage regulator CsrA
VKKGKPFYIEDTKVYIREIFTPTRFTVSVEGVEYQVTDEESIEIYPQVRVSCGGSCPEDFVKIVIEAPREIAIARESIYNQRKHGKDNTNQKSPH